MLIRNAVEHVHMYLSGFVLCACALVRVCVDRTHEYIRVLLRTVRSRDPFSWGCLVSIVLWRFNFRLKNAAWCGPYKKILFYFKKKHSRNS